MYSFKKIFYSINNNGLYLNNVSTFMHVDHVKIKSKTAIYIYVHVYCIRNKKTQENTQNTKTIYQYKQQYEFIWPNFIAQIREGSFIITRGGHEDMKGGPLNFK